MQAFAFLEPRAGFRGAEGCSLAERYLLFIQSGGTFRKGNAFRSRF